MWGVTTPEQAEAKIEEQKAEALAKMKAEGVTEPRNLEEQAQLLVGKDIYEILNKDTLRSFPCYENIVLDNDVTRITLYENISDYAKNENREKQIKFRKALKIDETAEKMKQAEEEEMKSNADPEVNIQEGSFEHGGVRLIHTYLKDGEIAHRSVADSVEERELDEDGKEVFKVIKEL